MFWNLLARLMARPRITAWLIERSLETPYYHLTRGDGEFYMMRFWLFNGYGRDNVRRFKWLPSLRIHWILRPDDDPNPHDHPCSARSFILKGRYVEERPEKIYLREQGTSVAIPFGVFHNILNVSDGGVWTLFVMYKRQDSWGFLVNGKKVDYRDYLGIGKQDE